MKVFVDGKAGTTGLKIYDRLKVRADVSLITLPEDKRKEPSARRDAINSSDITFLCLPDDAARESVGLCENGETVIIDTSTAHRTAPGWAYGFPELSKEHESKIRLSKRIAVPGCHASGFIALVYPLVEAGVIEKDERLCCFSLTGYSGGGKKMIAEYESVGRDARLDSPRQYGVGQCHKHLAEMKGVTGLLKAPVFSPIVAPYYSGMEVTVQLFSDGKKKTADYIKKIYEEKYSCPVVMYDPAMGENGFIAANEYSGLDIMKVGVSGNGERLVLTALYDNLGKGASGAAIENMNIAAGKNKTESLLIEEAK